MKYVMIELKEGDDINLLCGTKALSLIAIKNLGVKTPRFFAVPIWCYYDACNELGLDNTKFFLSPQFYPEMHKQFTDLYIANSEEIIKQIGEGEYMVRSSSVPMEDIDTDIFPSMISGAFDSYHAFTASDAVKAIPKIWASMFAEKAYNQCRIFSDKAITSGMGVLIQKYIEPVISGVAHTKENKVLVNWVEGHLYTIVSGTSAGNSIEMYKSVQCDYILRGVESNIISIIDKYENEFKRLFDYAMMIKKHFKLEQEIEWIYDGMDLWIVQAQSLLTMKKGDKNENRNNDNRS